MYGNNGSVFGFFHVVPKIGYRSMMRGSQSISDLTTTSSYDNALLADNRLRINSEAVAPYHGKIASGK